MTAVTAITAASLADSVGINTHLDFGGTYSDLAEVEANITYLGVSNIRDSAETTADYATWLTVANATGAKFDDYIAETSVAGMTTDLGYIATLASEGILNYVEGGDEEDDSYPASLGNTLAATAAFQKTLSTLGKSLDLPIINMSFGSGWTAANDWHGDYGNVGNLAAYATYANAHTYPSGAPGVTMQQLNADALLADASEPVITTEIGWTQDTLSQLTVAKYSLDAVLDGELYGDTKTYFYALYDDSSGSFGMFNADGTPRLAATAIHNLEALLVDTGSTASTFKAGSLNYTLTGTITGDNSLLSEKSNGSFWLALWNETETAGSPHTVTITLASAASTIEVFDPLTGITTIQTASDVSSIAVSVPDHPVLVEIIPETAAVVTPTPVTGTTITGTAGANDLVAMLNDTTVNSGNGNDTIFLSGTGDTVTTGTGNDSVDGFTGGNTITTGSGNDTIRIAGNGSVVNAGAGTNIIYDSGSSNTFILPSAGNGTDDIFGYVMQNSDTFNLTKALAGTTWNNELSTIGSYVHTSVSNNNAAISITDAASTKSGMLIATLQGTGSVSLATLLAHSIT